MKASRRGGSIVIKANVLDLAASRFSHLVEQKAIDRAADAKREHARVRMLLHFRDDLHVVADVTVSHEANDAHVRLIVRWLKCSLDGLHHLGAAIPRTGTEKRLRLI